MWEFGSMQVKKPLSEKRTYRDLATIITTFRILNRQLVVSSLATVKHCGVTHQTVSQVTSFVGRTHYKEPKKPSKARTSRQNPAGLVGPALVADSLCAGQEEAYTVRARGLNRKFPFIGLFLH